VSKEATAGKESSALSFAGKWSTSRQFGRGVFFAPSEFFLEHEKKCGMIVLAGFKSVCVSVVAAPNHL